MTVSSPFAFTDDELTHLRNHVESLLKTFYDSDIGPMCDYVITLLRTGDFDVNTLTTFAKDQLNDFLGDNTNDFVDRLMHDVVARSFLPRANSPPAAAVAPAFQPHEQQHHQSVADRIQLRPSSASAGTASPSHANAFNHPAANANANNANNNSNNHAFGAAGPMQAQQLQQQRPQQQGFQFQPIEPPRFQQQNNGFNQQRPPFQQHMHSQLPQPQQGFQQQQQQGFQPQQRICFQFRDQGFCSRGEACRYAHIRPDGGPRDPLQGRLGPLPTRDNNPQMSNPRWPHQPAQTNRVQSPPCAAPGFAPLGMRPPQPSSPTQHSGPGPQPQKSLAIHNIPEEHLRRSAVEDYFSRFGSIARVTIAEDPAEKRAFVTFNDLDAAIAAKTCPDAIFGNRFVRVSYYVEGMTFAKPGDSAGDASSAGAMAGRGRGRGGRGGGHMGAGQGWYPPPGGYYPPPGYPPVGAYPGYYGAPYGPMGAPMGGVPPGILSEQEAQERVAKATANLAKLESMWKKITEKLEGSAVDAAQRTELEGMAANLGKQMDAIKNRLVADPMTADLVPQIVKEVSERKKREALDAELAAIERQRHVAVSGAGAAASSAAASGVDKGMESDDDGLDIDVGSSAGGGSMSGTSVAGSGPATGAAAGAGVPANANPNWLAATQKYSLDLRPTSLLISGVPTNKAQEVIAAMATYGELVESSVVGAEQGQEQAAIVIKYKARVLAEKAMAGGVPGGVVDPMEASGLKVEWKF
ncbi:hypothetical protein BCR44DRAFT_89416 [Catenaria anguillulae PL171]|uniref:C3H1-type domain-containing protein n=1 Tax=Catenaria anguillulae PL171 TaxID=765915 RepID=A0A1Y2HD38_9FUNG|nr:hypothetical protein BCR44DRAFT_89416 [Catenaria anguillulae PL171]